jgi:hypothetical protein
MRGAIALIVTPGPALPVGLPPGGLDSLLLGMGRILGAMPLGPGPDLRIDIVDLLETVPGIALIAGLAGPIGLAGHTASVMVTDIGPGPGRGTISIGPGPGPGTGTVSTRLGLGLQIGGFMMIGAIRFQSWSLLFRMRLPYLHLHRGRLRFLPCLQTESAESQDEQGDPGEMPFQDKLAKLLPYLGDDCVPVVAASASATGYGSLVRKKDPVKYTALPLPGPIHKAVSRFSEKVLEKKDSAKVTGAFVKRPKVQRCYMVSDSAWAAGKQSVGDVSQLYAAASNKPAATVKSEVLHHAVDSVRDLIPGMAYGYWFLLGAVRAFQEVQTKWQTFKASGTGGEAIQVVEDMTTALKDGQEFLLSLDGAFCDVIHSTVNTYGNLTLARRDAHMNLLSPLLSEGDKKDLRFQELDLKSVFPTLGDAQQRMRDAADRETSRMVVKAVSGNSATGKSGSKKKSGAGSSSQSKAKSSSSGGQGGSQPSSSGGNRQGGGHQAGSGSRGGGHGFRGGSHAPPRGGGRGSGGSRRGRGKY